jgi:hypothetical protein
MTEPDAAVKDFTIHREPIRFRIDDDVFAAPAVISSITLSRVGVLAAELGEIKLDGDGESAATAIQLAGKAIGTLVPGPHGKRFVARLNSSAVENPDSPGNWVEVDADGDIVMVDDERGVYPKPGLRPIDLMRQGIPVLFYLLEQYGLRPTVPSSPLPAGSTDGATSTPSAGTSSTDGVSPADSDTAS